MRGSSILLAIVFGSAVLFPVWGCGSGPKARHGDRFQDLLRPPDAVTVVTEEGSVELAREGGVWRAGKIEVFAAGRDGRLRLELSAPEAAVKYIEARWTGDPPADWKYLGDAWERSYGELEWQPLDGAREMPWYFLSSDGRTTHGYGVMTQPAAMCAWRAGDGRHHARRPMCAAAGPASGSARAGLSSAR